MEDRSTSPESYDIEEIDSKHDEDDQEKVRGAEAALPVTPVRRFQQSNISSMGLGSASSEDPSQGYESLRAHGGVSPKIGDEYQSVYQSLYPSVYPSPLPRRSRSTVRSPDEHRRRPKRESPPPLHIDAGPVREYSTGFNRLNDRLHSFIAKPTARERWSNVLEKCGKCRFRILKINDSLQCSECGIRVHEQCANPPPLPCLSLPSRSPPVKGSAPLSAFCPQEGARIPPQLITLVCELEKPGRINREGIYRICGLMSAICKLVEKLRRDPRRDLSTVHHNVIAGSIKNFLRDVLNDGLVPLEEYQRFVDLTDSEKTGGSDAALCLAIGELPPCNQHTLAYMILHLRAIEDASANNKMTRINIAACLGMAIVGEHGEKPNRPINVHEVNRVLYRLLSIDPHFWDNILRRASGGPRRSSLG